MDAQVEAAIKACVTCQLHDKSAVTYNPPLQPVPYPEGAWEKLAIDVVGPFDKAPIDCLFAITLINYYSKWFCSAGHIKNCHSVFICSFQQRR